MANKVVKLDELKHYNEVSPDYYPPPSVELKHWGILGMKWGVRRFQNEDGSLTTAGKRRGGTPKLSRKEKRDAEFNKTLQGSGKRRLTEQNKIDIAKGPAKHPTKTSVDEQKKWAEDNDKYFSENQIKALTIPERMMVLEIGDGITPKRTETTQRVDAEHQPFVADGFGNHYATNDQETTTYWYNHESNTYRDIKVTPGQFVRKAYDHLHAEYPELEGMDLTEVMKKVKHSNTTEAELKHWGILGMKWGVRRFQNKDGTRTAAGKRRDSQLERQRDDGERSADYIKSRTDRNKGPASLSNEELKKLNERLQLESTYKNLTADKMVKAESFIQTALKKASGDALSSFAKDSMLAGAKLLVKEISPEFAQIAFKLEKKKK